MQFLSLGMFHPYFIKPYFIKEVKQKEIELINIGNIEIIEN